MQIIHDLSAENEELKQASTATGNGASAEDETEDESSAEVARYLLSGRLFSLVECSLPLGMQMWSPDAHTYISSRSEQRT